MKETSMQVIIIRKKYSNKQRNIQNKNIQKQSILKMTFLSILEHPRNFRIIP
jgi:hypothetical protein